MVVRRISSLLAAVFLLAGCDQEKGPLGPDRGEKEAPEIALDCVADVAGGWIGCEPAGSSVGGASDAIVGGQDEYVLLESFDVGYSAGLFSATVSVRNLMADPIGTTDGANPDPNGIVVFFLGEPTVVSGSGGVTIRNPSGYGNFTGSSQPFYRYSEVLSPGQSSSGRRWEWNVPATVEQFTFQVGVSTRVPNEDGIVPGPRLAASTLSVGEGFACALDGTGAAYCWGSNSNGQLGIGAAGDRSTPTPVAGSLSFASISAGVTHACGVTKAGKAWCWGEGASNRLGNGAVVDQLSPVPVNTSLTFTSISAGNSHTCAVSTAGDAYCWGSGGNAKIGTGSATGSATPFLVVDSLKYKSISSGYYNTCGITVDDRAVCWGNGNTGRSGDGITDTHNVLRPTQIESDEKFRSIVAGSAYTCALTIEGEAYCFGSNGSGQRGDGTTSATGTPTLVLGGHRFATIDVRFAHTCATTENGEAWCWGNNQYGRLGTGDTTRVREPVRVKTNASFEFVGVGREHSCGITREGRVYCWGRSDNAYQLGNGSATNRYTPVRVSPPNSGPAEIRPVTSTSTSAIYGEAIPVSVLVESAGLTLQGVEVRFEVVSGKGVVSDSLAESGPNGVATTLWLPGAASGEQKLRAKIGNSEVHFTVDASPPVPGKSYFGRKDYVEYIPGELPIILSSPHGGTLTPAEIPDRTWGTTVRDGELHDVTLRTAKAIENLTGKRPHVILMHLRRTKVDANREIVEAAQGALYSEWAWHEYHGWIDIAKDLARQSHGRGFYIDMHGHGHEIQRLELGYLLSAADLRRSDSQLRQAQYANKSSVRNLASEVPGGLVELLRGETSFGEMLVRRGYPAVPSKSDPAPLSGQRYFTGGYSTVRHGSRNGGTIDGVQIEHNSQGVRNNAAAREAYGKALGEAILEYLETHMKIPLVPAGR